jgi:DNA-directed RNA polymerase subunit RPC12/RpoP
MGLFDTVRLICPYCSKDVVVQSKAGDCTLAEHDEDAVPVYIANDILGKAVRCNGCGVDLIVLQVPTPPVTVKMRLCKG